MRFTAISGFGSKGPAAFLLETAGSRLLFDLGRGPDRGRRPDLSRIGRVDAVIVTHGHGDHVGSLDRLGEIGDPSVHATEPVRRLAASPALRTARDLPLRGQVRIGGIDVRTGRDGHAPGGIWLHVANGTSLFYSADVSVESEFYPFDPPPAADLAVIDAAYGEFDAPLEDAVAALRALAKAGPLLLPAPAAGRGLEMAVRLAEPDGPPVRLCPEHIAVARTLLSLPDKAALTETGRSRLQALATAGRLDPASPADGIMIAAGPNLDDGLAAQLAERFLIRDEARIVFTGHRAAGSPAERLHAEGKAGFMRWNVHPRLSDFHAIARTVGAKAIMPVFLDAAKLGAFASRLADLPLRLAPTLSS